MDATYELPDELWLYIFGYLSHEDPITLIGVNKAFRGCTNPVIWRTLTICSLRPAHIEKAQAILKNPYLARHVTHLCLRPAHWDPHIRTGHGLAPTSVWYTASPTFWRALKRWKWSRPVISWRYYRQSLESIDVSMKVLPLLTHIKEVTALPYAFLGGSLPSLEPHRKVWAGLRTEHLQRLNLQFSSLQSFLVCSRTMNSAPPVVFGSLKTLILELGMRDIVTPALQDDLRTIFDCGRSSLRRFKLVACRPTARFLVTVLKSLGIFPNLTQFHLESTTFIFDTHIPTLAQHLLPFLLNHRSTLTKLHLSTFPPLGPLLQSLLGGQNQAFHHLEAFTLRYGLMEEPPGSRFPSFKQLAGTLTCLRFQSYSGDDGLVYEELKALFEGLYRPIGGIGLKQLRIRVRSLCPEVLDLMAGSLTNLECLELNYRKISGNKDQLKGYRDLFFKNMESRCYSHWGLRCIDVKFFRISAESVPEPIPTQFIRRIIPSLQRVGEIDWSDVDFD